MDKSKLNELVAESMTTSQNVRVRVEEGGDYMDLLHHFPVAARQLRVRVLADTLDVLRDKRYGRVEAQLRVTAAELAHASLCVWRSSDDGALTRVIAYAGVMPALMGHSPRDLHVELLEELPCIGAWQEVLRDLAGEDEVKRAGVSYAARAAWMRWVVAEADGVADVADLLRFAEASLSTGYEVELALPAGSIEVDGVRLASEGRGTSVWLDEERVASSELFEGGIIGTDVPRELSEEERARIAAVFSLLFGTRADYVMSVAVPTL